MGPLQGVRSRTSIQPRKSRKDKMYGTTSSSSTPMVTRTTRTLLRTPTTWTAPVLGVGSNMSPSVKLIAMRIDALSSVTPSDGTSRRRKLVRWRTGLPKQRQSPNNLHNMTRCQTRCLIRLGYHRILRLENLRLENLRLEILRLEILSTDCDLINYYFVYRNH